MCAGPRCFLSPAFGELPDSGCRSFSPIRICFVVSKSAASSINRIQNESAEAQSMLYYEDELTEERQAEADLRGIKREYVNKGVTMFPAAIGKDKEKPSESIRRDLQHEIPEGTPFFGITSRIYDCKY